MPEWLPGLAVQLPLVAAVVYGFVSRQIRSQGEVKDQERAYEAELQRRETQHGRELGFLEARRAEEREGRISAERRVSELTERWDRSLQILASIEREMIRASSRLSDRPERHDPPSS